ncbi:hypothetical protein [Saliphagus sp. LR7]|uniref:hypothetical protein n=1 Tax=Saliphagus sp. LR7 TaxID=2282654 RepID=UPI000DF856E7|nr:hypothetical protein [Saliphagus sp. LR7]
MAHTCDACDETFKTLTKLRLHDCPGPALSAPDHVTKIVEETGELTQGDVLATFPDQSVSVEVVEELGEAEEIQTALPLMSGSPGTGQTERIVLQTEVGAGVIEYFPQRGWVAVRTVRVGEKSEEEVYGALMEQMQDWQSVVTELALGHASGDHDIKKKLREELGI